MSRRILVNARFASRAISGVERYAMDITRILGDRVSLIKPPRSIQGALGHLWEQLVLPFFVPEEAVLWSPANSGPLTRSNQVITIHDIAPLDHQEWYSAAFAAWYGFLLPRLAHKVRLVMTDSDFSKARLVKRLRLDQSKVIVVHPGVAQERFHQASKDEVRQLLERFSLRQPFLLYVGALQPRKNIARLLQAWDSIQPKFPDLELVLAGTAAAHFQDPGLVNRPPGVRLLGRVEDADLPGLYSAALGVVVPSLYEGFCLTGLEALACGTPVIASEIPAFREALGEAACYFDPNSSEAIAVVMTNFLCDASLKDRLVAQGYSQVRRFRVDQSAEMIWKVLNES